MRRGAQRAALAATLAALLATLPVSGARAGSLDRVAPGTTGVVHTVVQDNVLEEIPVRFLGVFEDAAGPGHDIYLVELEGPVAERVGVAAGMSGSPVYVDGELIGALAYRYGLLPKRAVGGVTPIERMLDSSRAATAGPPAGVRTGAVPIDTPLHLGGVAPAVRDWLAPQLERHGFRAVAGGGREDPPDPGSALAPGMPVGLQLVGGDLTIAASGTVTWIDGDDVYALGHPLFGSGRVSMPMTTARVVHTVADMAGSVKLTNVGREVGAILEDRLSAVVGRKGVRAPMIPVELTIEGASYGSQRFGYEVVRHPNLVPLLVGAVASSSLLNNPGYDDSLTIVGSGRVRLAGLPDLAIELAYSGDGPAGAALAAASRLQAILAVLYRNPLEDPRVESIALEFRPALDRREYTLETLLYDRRALVPGGSLTVGAVLRGWRGARIRRELTMRLPPDLEPGSELRLAVGDVGFIDRALGQPIARRVRTAQDVAALVEALSAIEAPHRLGAVLYRAQEVVVAEGLALDGLPLTARRLLGGTEGADRTRAAPVARAGTVLDGPVTGGQVVTLEVRDGVAPESR